MTDEQRGIHNERTKLVATYFNNLAVALVAVGAIGPIIGTAVGNSATSLIYPVISAFVCLLASAALHFMAGKVLGRLEP
ncbi:amino acid transporter [Pseudaminobacter sp. 19-2017]|uniref:Amino acid transporter n=1 Tax=Pseudaminobacter soli (ex Zhang et al. 2022) TaxID=2831468 RepID=A0A942IAK5_9HYPH|nr:amino acid transporter [Pseudaminobacter soli]MBS3651425.1 amino acid transporter [Pseudaminobacter soli]